MKIYVIRHGKSEANMLGVHNAPETKLASVGVTQAENLRDKIKNIDYDAIICSPFIRTKQTAEIINVKNKNIVFDDRLKERNFGPLIGSSLHNIDRDGYWNYYNEKRYNECEDIKTFLNRINSFIEDLKLKEYKSVLIVTHKGVSRAFEVYFNGLGDGKLFKKGITNCEIEEFELTDNISQSVNGKLTSKEARKILENTRKSFENQGWIDHSICVGDTAGKIAEALNQKGMNLDVDKVIALGYIHDIGKRYRWNNGDGVIPHAINGYNHIKSLGYDEDYAGICIKHSFLNNDINCLANDRDYTDLGDKNYEFIKEYIKNEYTVYEKLINLCDLMCTDNIYTLDKRMMDLLLRHGVYKNTHYHLKEAYKLKEYFDNLLGCNLYDLFPEIKDNL